MFLSSSVQKQSSTFILLYNSPEMIRSLPFIPTFRCCGNNTKIITRLVCVAGMSPRQV